MRASAAAAASIVRVRHLAFVLFALLLAAALAIGAYAASWSLRRAPHPQLPSAPVRPAPTLPTPERLADSPDFARKLAPAPERGDPALVDLTIEVVDVPPAWQPPAAGVAVVSRRGGDGIAWLPLTSGSGDAGTLRFRRACVLGDEVVVALAPTRTNALRSYLARTTAAVGAATTVRLDARSAEVAIRGADDGARRGPFRLQRDGDDAWLPAEAPAGVQAAGPVRLWLGAGSYRLVDVSGAGDDIAFRVPETTDVVVSAPTRPVPDGRR